MSSAPLRLRRERNCRFEQLEPRRLLAADVAAPDVPAITTGLAEASLAGQVHLSESAACQGFHQPASHGIADVTLRLLDEQGQTVQTAVTDDAGRYQFNGLKPGLYAVLQRQPSGLTDAGLRIGSGGGQLLSQNLVGEIEVHAGAALVGYDFCESTSVSTQIDGPPQLDRQGAAAIIAGASNVILRGPASYWTVNSASSIHASHVAAASPAAGTSSLTAEQAALPAHANFAEALGDDFGNIATRRRDNAGSIFDSKVFGSALERIRDTSIIDALFDRVSWNSETLRQAVIDPLTWLVPKTPETKSAQHEGSETAETSEPVLEVAALSAERVEVVDPEVAPAATY